jgi:hypothetical protein
MPLGNPGAGIGYAPEFQSSALPWVTSSQAPANGSPQEIDFPNVSRFLTLINQDSTHDMSVAFTLNGGKGGNRVVVPHASALTFELRVSKIWVQSEDSSSPHYSLCAGLTTIPTSNMPPLTGTNPDGSAGWQGVG